MVIPGIPDLGAALHAVLGDRLGAAVVYGSAVTGDFIPGFSDVDLAIFAHGGPGLDEARALQREAAALAAMVDGQLQLSHWIHAGRESARPLFVPGSLVNAWGEPPGPGWLHSEQSLRESGRSWLAELPALVRRDAADWAVASGQRRTGMVRLLATRLKPAIRAALAEQGYPALEVWVLPWSGLTDLWSRSDEAGANALRETIGRLPPSPTDEQAVGDALLAMLWAGLDHGPG
ncbi:nucleotidyltransferase domain-containing protein [bacterium]|nr:MAG: nucleotidyltransferase domain-containing protein [bacterium]